MSKKERENAKKAKVKEILNRAKKAPKRSYAVYSHYSNQIFDVGLDWRAGEKALQQLANILRV